MAVGCAPSLWGTADCHFPHRPTAIAAQALHNPHRLHWPGGGAGVADGALLDCDVSGTGVGIGDGGWFVGGVGGSFVGAELGIDEADGSLVVDDVPVVSACWPHPLNPHPARAIAAKS